MLVVIFFVSMTAVVLVVLRTGKKGNNEGKEDLKEWMRETREVVQQTRREMQENLGKNTESLERQLTATNKTLSERLDKAAQVIGGVQRELGKVSETSQMMKDMQQYLLSPKLRGNVGEEILENLLRARLPRKNYGMQYKFQSGETVDAVVRVAEGIIPIDAKFPLENFRALQKAETQDQRDKLRQTFRTDVKKHVRDIARKYILPGEQTMDFAMMYVPAEAVFHEIIDSEEIVDLAREKHIHIVSPNSFYMYLGAVLQGLRGQQINEQAKHIMASLGAVKEEARRFEDSLNILSTHITNAKNASEKVGGRYQKLSAKIEGAAALGEGEKEGEVLESERA